MTIANHPSLATAELVPPLTRTVLHVGCGMADPAKLPAAFFPAGEWSECRLDIDPGVAPDIVASITDMSVVPTGSVQAVWSAHNLEHLFPHEVPLALSEFHRVLAPGGFVLVTMPDLQQVAALVAEGRLEDAAYMSAMGPISAIDMLYGHRASIASGNHFMGHRGGFVATSLASHLERAGFQAVRVQRDGHFALWGSGVKV
ncbi:class I SAM-dependent methyltransferase [Stagnihabitans tardus]|uniref:Methyltransferase domain-containing protein n=1 Tax=Stagnihabitans tardus TaxID=2699202 RepID=A0AAE4Y6X6_9RHOB|nr:class I SAM-dependent methyltransferase [Stagnihabitans tardus]NBZ86244.1 methyltransferase domain-containing protein [Stagnihabitans tardus]